MSSSFQGDGRGHFNPAGVSLTLSAAKINTNFEITKYKCKFICLFNIIYDIIVGFYGCIAPPGLMKERCCAFPQVPLTLHMRLRRSLRDLVSPLRGEF